MRQKPKTPMQITRAPNPAKKATKASCVLWNARIIARFEMPNVAAHLPPPRTVVERRNKNRICRKSSAKVRLSTVLASRLTGFVRL